MFRFGVSSLRGRAEEREPEYVIRPVRKFRIPVSTSACRLVTST